MMRQAGDDYAGETSHAVSWLGSGGESIKYTITLMPEIPVYGIGMNMKSYLSFLNARLFDQLIAGLIAALFSLAIPWIFNFTTTNLEKGFFSLSFICFYLFLLFLYNYFTATLTLKSTRDKKLYEDHLTDLARQQWDVIIRSSKTSIWADAEDVFGRRKHFKSLGVSKQRIKTTRYILHFSFWRKKVLEDSACGNFDSLDLYRSKLHILLSSIRNYQSCPPDKIKFVVGETDIESKFDTCGVYLSEKRKILIRPYIDLLADLQMNIFVDGDESTVMTTYKRLESDWQKYLQRQNSASSNGRTKARNALSERKSFERQVIAELEWTNLHDKQRQSEPSNELAASVISSVIADHFNVGRVIAISCPQKATISGDYCDMHSRGQSLTAAISIRPYLTIQQAESSYLKVGGRIFSTDLFPTEKWKLLHEFASVMSSKERSYRVEIWPTSFMGRGMGSSGAASLLFVAAQCLMEGRNVTRRELISLAHQFETTTCGQKCGPQDHTASCLGGFRLIDFPNLNSQKIPDPHWSHFSFWIDQRERNAAEIIPDILNKHNSLLWRRKHACTMNVVDGMRSNDETKINDGIRENLKIQYELGAVSDGVRNVGKKIVELGGAVKLSGAGQSGLIVVYIPERQSFDQIREVLRSFEFEEMHLTIDNDGIKFQVSDLPLPS